MNEITKPPSDDEFQRELDAVSRAYRSAPADAAAEGPPAAIDEAIRAAARRAVNAGPRSVEATWLKRWTRPLSAAALLVLTVSIGFVALDESPQLAPLTAETLKEKVALPAETTVAPAPPALRADAAQASVVPLAKQATPLDYNTVPARPAPAERESMAPQKRRDSDAAAAVDKLASHSEVTIAPTAPSVARQVVPPSTAAAIASPRVAAPPAYAPPPPPAPAPPAAQATAPPPASIAAAQPAPIERKYARAEVGGLSRDSANTAPAATGGSAAAKAELAKAAAPAAAAKLAAVPAAAADSVAETKLDAPAPAPAAPRAAPAVPAATAPVVAAAERVAAASRPTANKDDTADAWIKRILELKTQQKTREADEELAKFRKRYPDYPLPPALNPLKEGR